MFLPVWRKALPIERASFPNWEPEKPTEGTTKVKATYKLCVSPHRWPNS